MSCKSLRKEARESLSGKWGIAVLIYLIYSGITSAISMIGYNEYSLFSILGAVASVAISGPMAFGFCYVCLKISRREEVNVGQLFSGFASNMWNKIGVWALMSIYTILWYLLFIIPGIIASYSYAMTYYIMADNPNIGPREAILKSKEIMNGHKWRLFCLNMSFFGWYLLGILSLGIGLIWIIPYVQTAQAEFYKDLVGIVSAEGGSAGVNSFETDVAVGTTVIQNESDVAPFMSTEDAVVVDNKNDDTRDNVLHTLECEVCGAREVHKEVSAKCSYCGGDMK